MNKRIYFSILFLFLLVLPIVFADNYVDSKIDLTPEDLSWFKLQDTFISSGQECIDAMTKNSYSIYKNSSGQLIKKGLITSGEELYANSNCLKVEDAKSLKDTWIIPTINYGKDKDDPKDITILDYNWTIKTIQINDKVDEISYFVKDKIEKEIIKDIKDNNVIKIDSEGFKEIHFGNESTIVSFNYTYLIEDTTIAESTPTTDYHTNGNLFLGVYISGAMATILEYNRTKLNLDGDATIVSSNISLYLENKGGIGADSINITCARYLGNQSMANIRWSNANFYGVNWTKYMMFQDVNLTSSDDSRVFFNTTTMTQANVDNTDYKFTYVFYSNLSLSESGRVTEYGLFTSSNGGTVANRPILNIEYTELVSVPSVGIQIITPSTNQANYSQYQWHKIDINVSCTGADCGDINVSLDPTDTCDCSSGTCTGCSDMFIPDAGNLSYDSASWGTMCLMFMMETHKVCTNTTGDYSFYTVEDSGCDEYTVSGSNNEDCAYVEYLDPNTWMPTGWACPSYDRLGSAVDSSDCSDLCMTGGDADDFFDFDDPFFAGAVDVPKALVNTTQGALPFWTNKSSNPFTINLNASQSQVVTFWINATGNVGSEYEFFAYANMTSNMTISNISTNWTGTITDYIDYDFPEIKFIDYTPVDELSQTQPYFNYTVSINASDVKSVLFNLNGTNYTASDGLVLAYSFDNDTNIGENETNIVDMVQGNNLTTIGSAVDTIEGKSGGGYLFIDDENSFLRAETTSNLVGLENLTLAMWIKPNSTNSGDLFRLGARSANNGWHLGLSSGELLFHTQGNTYSTSGANIELNKWNFIVFSYSDSNVTMYVNGSAKYSANTVDITYDGSTLVNIGSDYDDGYSPPNKHSHYNGTLDEIRLYNKAFNSQEVLGLQRSFYKRVALNDWVLWVNETGQGTDELDLGTYTYQSFAIDTSGNINQTEERTITIGNYTPSDSCVISTNSNHLIQCSDLCNITQDVMQNSPYTLEINGTVGKVNIEANITTSLYTQERLCEVIIEKGKGSLIIMED